MDDGAAVGGGGHAAFAFAVLTFVPVLMSLHCQPRASPASQAETRAAQASALPAFTAASEQLRHARVQETFGKMPVYFVEHRGQMDGRVADDVQGRDRTLYFTPPGLTFALTSAVVLAAQLAVPYNRRVRSFDLQGTNT